MLVAVMLLTSCAAGGAGKGDLSFAPDSGGTDGGPSVGGGYFAPGDYDSSAGIPSLPPTSGGGDSIDKGDPSAPEGGESAGEGDSSVPDSEVDSIPDDTVDEGDKTEGDTPVQSTAGLITASAWDDNAYYSAWRALFEQKGDGTVGKFHNYLAGSFDWGFDSQNRVRITVKNGDTPLAGARVSITDGTAAVASTAVTDANGVAYLFASQNGSVTVTLGDATATASFDSEHRDLNVNLNTGSAKRDVIELMFVIDATGSMGDEISYLKAEIADVIGRVSKDMNATIYLSFLFYRDHCDRDVFDFVDFVNVTEGDGLARQQSELSRRHATGGGDYAEAAEEALLLAAEKQWSEDATTKIIFQLLDAPPHGYDENRVTMRRAVSRLSERGIRFCPILCSGADLLTEYVMREAAIHTGGTFVFVTDHSGIGGSHHDPDIPNATVEALNSLMVRLIRGYHSGHFDDPVDWRTDQNK